MHKLLILILFISCAQLSPKSKSRTYLRKDWKHWSDSDGNCLNIRQEILKARSLVPVTLNRKGCGVVKGKWQDYYYPEIHTESRKVDIDHLIPLKNAHETGGHAWSKNQREAFANDPENLVITNLKYNRQKGAKGIDAWLPVHKNYACQYMKDWIKIKKKYHLEITSMEQHAIKLTNCR